MSSKRKGAWRPSSHARDKPPIIRRAELQSAVYRDERRWIEAELEMALAGREAMLAEAFLVRRHSSAPHQLHAAPFSVGIGTH